MVKQHVSFRWQRFDVFSMIGFVFDDQMFGVVSPEQMFDGLILNAVLEMRWAE